MAEDFRGRGHVEAVACGGVEHGRGGVEYGGSARVVAASVDNTEMHLSSDDRSRVQCRSVAFDGGLDESHVCRRSKLFVDLLGM